MTVISYPPYFSLFPRLKIKLNGCHFDTTEVIEAESQAVLDTLIEHTTSRMHLKNGRRTGNGVRAQKGNKLDWLVTLLICVWEIPRTPAILIVFVIFLNPSNASA
jgi:hypothetical protein